MSEHHKDGVEMAKMAVEKAKHEEVREMASMMVQAQAQELAQLQEWRKEWYPEAKPSNSHSVGMRMEKLASMNGLDFDLGFLDSMKMHHPGAIYLGIEAQERAEHDALKALALKIKNAQIKELNEIRDLREKIVLPHE